MASLTLAGAAESHGDEQRELTVGFSAVELTGNLDKSTLHEELGCKSLTGRGLRQNEKRRSRESKDRHSFEKFCC